MKQHHRAAGYENSLKVNHPVMWATTLRQACGHPSYQKLLHRRQRTPCNGPGDYSSMTHSDLALQIMSYTLSSELIVEL